MIDIAFAGASHGMTNQQRESVADIVTELVSEGSVVAHHGEGGGSDSQFHDICLLYQVESVVLHPLKGIKPNRKLLPSVFRQAPKPLIARNREMIDDSDLLIVAPSAHRSAYPDRWAKAWHIVQYARQSKIRTILIVWTNGEIQTEYPSATNEGATDEPIRQQ